MEREKLINAIIFFAKNTDYCFSLKLFKLLFFLDFEVFRQTGKSTTGLRYFALPRGPVPLALHGEILQPGLDLKNAVSIQIQTMADADFKQVNFRAKQPFEEGCFTKRELKVMEHLVFIFKTAQSTAMTNVSHDRDSSRAAAAAWHQVHEIEKRPNAEISYLLALDGKPGAITRDQAEAIAADLKEAEAFFK